MEEKKKVNENRRKGSGWSSSDSWIDTEVYEVMSDSSLHSSIEDTVSQLSEKTWERKLAYGTSTGEEEGSKTSEEEEDDTDTDEEEEEDYSIRINKKKDEEMKLTQNNNLSDISTMMSSINSLCKSSSKTKTIPKNQKLEKIPTDPRKDLSFDEPSTKLTTNKKETNISSPVKRRKKIKKFQNRIVKKETTTNTDLKSILRTEKVNSQIQNNQGPITCAKLQKYSDENIITNKKTLHPLNNKNDIRSYGKSEKTGISQDKSKENLLKSILPKSNVVYHHVKEGTTNLSKSICNENEINKRNYNSDKFIESEKKIMKEEKDDRKEVKFTFKNSFTTGNEQSRKDSEISTKAKSKLKPKKKLQAKKKSISGSENAEKSFENVIFNWSEFSKTQNISEDMKEKKNESKLNVQKKQSLSGEGYKDIGVIGKDSCKKICTNKSRPTVDKANKKENKKNSKARDSVIKCKKDSSKDIAKGNKIKNSHTTPVYAAFDREEGQIPIIESTKRASEKKKKCKKKVNKKKSLKRFEWLCQPKILRMSFDKEDEEKEGKWKGPIRLLDPETKAVRLSRSGMFIQRLRGWGVKQINEEAEGIKDKIKCKKAVDMKRIERLAIPRNRITLNEKKEDDRTRKYYTLSSVKTSSGRFLNTKTWIIPPLEVPTQFLWRIP